MEKRDRGGHIAALLVVGLASLLIPTTPSSLATDGGASPVQVELRNWAFQPDTIEASPGDVVLLVNRDPWDHLVVVGNQEQGMIRLPSGGTVRIPVVQHDEIRLRCLHYSWGVDAGMVAVIHVGLPQASGGRTSTGSLFAHDGPTNVLVGLQVVGLAAPLAALALMALRLARGRTTMQTRDTGVATHEPQNGHVPSRGVRFVRMVQFVPMLRSVPSPAEVDRR